MAKAISDQRMERQVTLVTNMNCIICQNNIGERIYPCKDYLSNEIFIVNKCIHCKSLITHVDPDIDLSKYYGDIYYNNKKGKFIFPVQKLFSYFHKKHAMQFYTKWEPEFIIDFGCGRGELLSELKNFGCNTYGIEANDAANWILDNNDIKVETYEIFKSETINEIKGSADFVIFWHVLEHLMDPHEALRNAAIVLKSNGILCISVPNIDSLQASMSYKNWFHLDVPRHLVHFNVESLEDLIEEHGLKIIQMESGDWYQNLFGWFQSLANIFSGSCNNSVYKLIQGRVSCHKENISLLFIQLITFPLWFGLGILGTFIEALINRQGTITIYAKKL